MWYLIPGFLQEQGSDPECMATFNRENNHNSVDLGMAYFQTNLTCSQATKLSIKKHRPTSRCCITMHNKDPWRKNNGDLHETNLVSCYPEVETTPYLHGYLAWNMCTCVLFTEGTQTCHVDAHWHTTRAMTQSVRQLAMWDENTTSQKIQLPQTPTHRRRMS